MTAAYEGHSLPFIGSEASNEVTSLSPAKLKPAALAALIRPLVVSCGIQQSESLLVVEPGGHVGRLPLSLSTCPRGCSQEKAFGR